MPIKQIKRLAMIAHCQHCPWTAVESADPHTPPTTTWRVFCLDVNGHEIGGHTVVVWDSPTSQLPREFWAAEMQPYGRPDGG